MTDLEKIEARMAAIQAEFREFETAARVLRRLCGQEVLSPPQRRNRGKKPPRPKIRDLAKAVLQEKGEAHYSVVADEAIKRGYKGRANATVEKIRRAYWSTMHRMPEMFTSTGGGKFKLKKEKAQ